MTLSAAQNVNATKLAAMSSFTHPTGVQNLAAFSPESSSVKTSIQTFVSPLKALAGGQKVYA